MEPNKLENQFREKLNHREINPSQAGWDRLEEMLSVASKPKRKFTWLYIAASFIGFLLISTVFFKQKNTIDIKKNTVVIENKITKPSLKTEIKSQTEKLNFSKAVENQETKPLVQTQQNIKKNIDQQIIKTPEKVVAQIQLDNQNEPIAVNEKASPENIDSLLASIDETSNSDLKKASIKVNSTALLNQVDGELQVSFREKALNTITKKYKEAKEAFANRNNQ